MLTWAHRQAFLLDEARGDLEDGVDARPCLLAFRGEDALLVAFLRAHVRGGHVDALFEVLSLAVPLGADRLALSLAGRAWSLRDPLPPVIDGLGDLRQRVLCVEQVDGTGGRIVMDTTAVPFEQDAGGQVIWLPPLDTAGTLSRVASALAASLHHRGRMEASMNRLRRRAVHLADLGHTLGLSPAVHDRLFGADEPVTAAGRPAGSTGS